MSGTEINDSWKFVFASARLLGAELAHRVSWLKTHVSDGVIFTLNTIANLVSSNLCVAIIAGARKNTLF